MKILVTGAAGFIGFHTSRALLARGDEVVGIDNINDYYEVSLKHARLELLTTEPGFTFQKLDLADRHGIEALFKDHGFDRVVNLAAQAGVRYGAINPYAYIDSNISGFLHILEGCRHNGVEHLVYAPSSSVYGANESLPFSVSDNVDHPLSLYAASKKANELMAHSYSHLYDLPTTGLRFFTVYGPWGRPDMALFLFTKAILNDEPIDVFNYGNHKRDFTYIDDIVEGVIRTLDKVAAPNPDWRGTEPDPGSSREPWRVYNIGNSAPVNLSTTSRPSRNVWARPPERIFCRSSLAMCPTRSPMCRSCWMTWATNPQQPSKRVSNDSSSGIWTFIRSRDNQSGPTRGSLTAIDPVQLTVN